MVVVLELVVVPEVLLLEAVLVAVADVKSNVLPSTFTFVSGAFPNLKVTLVAELGIVIVCDVDDDSVPCQLVAPLTVTATQALVLADSATFGLDEAFFISQVEPEDVVLSCLKLATFFLEEDFEDVLLDFDELLLEDLLELPETLTELLSTLSFLVLLPLREAATQIPTNTTSTTITMPITGIVRRSFTYRSSTFRCCERVSGLFSLTLSTYSCVCVLGRALSNCFNSSAPSRSTMSAYCLIKART